jgi:uncharacterized protein YdhG (YjbR/CyaY superfamily)
MDATPTQIQTIDDYIQSFPSEVRDKLKKLRQTIREEISNVEEVISYKMPAFKQDGHFIIYFGAWKKHISLYPFSVDMAKSLKESSHYRTSGKGTIQFPLDQPLPLPLIRKIVQFRLKENAAK